MLNSGPGGSDPNWVNVEASPFNVLLDGTCNGASDNPGDPCGYNAECPNGSCSGEDTRPDPALAPFQQDPNTGETTVVCADPNS